MLVTLYQNQYVLLTSGDISPLGLICLSNSKKKYFEVEKKKAIPKSLQDAKTQLIVQHKYGI